MCASYGLQAPDEGAAFGIKPMDTREGRATIAEWSGMWGGKANITREQKAGLNLNPIIRVPPVEATRSIALAWWWFHIGGRPAKYTAFNSRDDTLLTKWKQGFQHRALLPATWYMEGKKQWQLPSGEPFAIAAILSSRTLPDGSTGFAYSLVTREGIGEASTVVTARGDSRMPLVLPHDLHDEWLNPERPGDESLVAAVQEGSVDISLAMTTNAPTNESQLAFF